MQVQSHMQLKLHTLIIVIGPPSCGKSYLINNFIKPQLQKKLSEHKIRNMLPHLDTKDAYPVSNSIISKITKTEMQKISIINQLSQYMDYPFSEPFIILECGLCNEDFVTKCKNVATEYHYNIEYINFNYKTHKDFLKFTKFKKSTQEHVDTYKKTILSQLNVANIYDLTITKTPIYNIVTEFNLVFNENNFKKFLEHSLDTDKKYFIVGDIHSCIDEFKELLINNKFTITDDIITCNKYDLILIGDLIDKGCKNAEIIDFIHKNINNPRIKFVRGNHEETVYELLTDNNKQFEFKPDFISKYYNTFLEIKDSPETKAKFIEIYNLMKPFYFYDGDKRSHSFYVNHSPCSRNILYKIDNSSINNQVYRCCVNITEAKLTSILSNKNGFDVPYQIVGHVQMEEAYFTTNNMIFIDTGCISGGKLTGIKLGRGILYPKFKSVNYMNKQPNIISDRLKINNINFLSKNNNNHYVPTCNTNDVVKKLISNKINFISGTISPSNKLVRGDITILESLDSCFSYFYNKYQEKKCYHEIVIMPKYMGSRINVYLFRDFEQSYGITRNGYKAKVSQEIFKNLHSRLDDYMAKNNIKMMIIDGELMPWSLLAKGLIDETFGAISTGLQYTASMLQRTGFDIAYKRLCESTKNMNPSDKNCFSQQVNTHITSLKMEELGNKYTEQLNIYSQDDVPHIKAFSILKIVFEDDTEFLPGLIDMNDLGIKEDGLGKQMTNDTCFKLVNDDKILVIDLNESYDDSLDTIKEFFDSLVSSSYEGIVVRPNLVDPKIMTPYMKVRNEGYLRLTYGYDYQESHKYQQLVKKKNIKKKLLLSKQQFKLGVKMLKVPYANLNKDKDIIKKYIETFLKSDTDSRNIDPRL